VTCTGAGPSPLEIPLQALAARYRTGSCRPTDVVAAAHDRLAGIGTELGAVTEVVEDAVEHAHRLTAELAAGHDRGPLHGVPIVVKELIDLAGHRRTAGTRVEPSGWDVPAAQDAVVVATLRAAGAIVVARARTHEFAWGITTRHPRGDGVVNPLDPTRIAGGSSGGVAALVAAGCAPIGVGTDTGGSVRIPASFCGLVGWKPTVGRLSVRGVVPLAPTFDHVGVLTRTVEEATIVDAVLGGGLAGAGSSAPDPAATGVRVAVLDDPSLPALAAAIGRTFATVVERAGITAPLTAGAGTGQVPAARELIEGHTVLQRAEALGVHRDLLRTWPDQVDRYGEDVAGRLRDAERLDPTAVVEARLSRREAQARWHRGVEQAGVAAVVLPAAACGPSSIDDPDTAHVDGRALPLRDAVMPFTVPANMIGWPALVVPGGPGEHGPPASVQLVARPGSEHLLPALAARFAARS
jgi:aspartyl-tRNA(Asn)/glutamyl-tRNA(Gln) amidotransferase subunit A